MGFIKGALVGAAVYAAIQHITKRDILTGKSKLDQFLESAPEVVDRAKTFAQEVGIASEPEIILTEETLPYR